MFSDLNLEFRQESLLVNMFGHNLHQRESQHARGIGVLEIVELPRQNIADAVIMNRHLHPL